MYIYGGRRHDNVILDDLWALDLASMRWTRMMADPHGSPIPPLFSHTLTAVNGEMLLLLGGCPEQEAGGSLPGWTVIPVISRPGHLAQSHHTLGRCLSIQKQQSRCYIL